MTVKELVEILKSLPNQDSNVSVLFQDMSGDVLNLIVYPDHVTISGD